jgi:hypothetical protein
MFPHSKQFIFFFVLHFNKTYSFRSMFIVCAAQVNVTLSSFFLEQLRGPDDDVVGQGLAHVVDGQRTYRAARKRLHLHSSLSGHLHTAIDLHSHAKVIPEGTVVNIRNEAEGELTVEERKGVAKRDQETCQLHAGGTSDNGSRKNGAFWGLKLL